MNSVGFDVNKAGLNINDLSTEDLDRLRYKWARLKGLLKVKDTLSSMYGKRGEKINQDKDISSTLTYNLSEAKKEDAVDTITMDIPLFLRMLEYSREDASQDMDLHDVTEKANSLGKERGILSMEDYDEIVGAAEDAPKSELSERISFDKALDLKLEKADLKKEIEQVRTDMEEEADESKANYYGRQLNKLEDRLAKVQKQIDDYDMNESTDYMKRRKAMDDYATSKKDKPAKSYNPKPSGKTDYMKRREKDLAEAILAKLKK